MMLFYENERMKTLLQKIQVKNTARIIMNYSKRSNESSVEQARKIIELQRKFESEGPQLIAYYHSANGRVHVVKAELIKTGQSPSLFIPFHDLLGDKNKTLTMRITHFLGFVHKDAVRLPGQETEHVIYETTEGYVDGEFIEHTPELD